jgi:uncharacterized HAD superfamily protein
MLKRKLGIDIDGTVTCPTTFIPYLNRGFNLNLTLKDLTEYNLAAVLGTSDEAFYKWMKEHESVIYENAPLVAHVMPILTNWHNKHELIYISARPQEYFDITNDWFSKNGVPFHYIELIGKHDKLEAVKHHNIDVFFEDKHDNACDISEECKIPVILFNTPYNQNPVPRNVVRVNDWNEAHRWVENYFTNK